MPPGGRGRTPTSRRRRARRSRARAAGTGPAPGRSPARRGCRAVGASGSARSRSHRGRRAVAEEGVGRREPGGQLRRVQVPALVEAALQGPPDQPGVQPQAARTAVGRPTGSTLVEPSDSRTPVPAAATCITALAWSAAGWSRLWYCGRDADRGAVVVGAVVQPDAAPGRGVRSCGPPWPCRPRRAPPAGSRSAPRTAARRRPARAPRSSRPQSTTIASTWLDRAHLGQRDDEARRAAARARRGTRPACAPPGGGSPPPGSCTAARRTAVVRSAPCQRRHDGRGRPAAASSSSSARTPYPSSKSIRRSSIGSRASLAATRSTHGRRRTAAARARATARQRRAARTSAASPAVEPVGRHVDGVHRLPAWPARPDSAGAARRRPGRAARPARRRRLASISR